MNTGFVLYKWNCLINKLSKVSIYTYLICFLFLILNLQGDACGGPYTKVGNKNSLSEKYVCYVTLIVTNYIHCGIVSI